MELYTIKKGFSLIELLVVVTIAGILATGATVVYTSQIQKSRDSKRVTDIETLRVWVEHFFQDYWVYPVKWTVWINAFTWVMVYTPKLPKDPKSSQASALSAFDYTYNVSKDSNFIPDQEYEISTTFEQKGNIQSKALTDWWNDPDRYEIWIDLDDVLGTDIKPTLVHTKILSTTPTMSCVGPGGTLEANCTDGTSGNPNNRPMVVRWNP